MQKPNELITIRDFIRWSVSLFIEKGLYFGHGTDNAWDEAVALVLHTLYLPKNIDRDMLQANLTQAERHKLFELIEQRVEKRIPLAYLLKETHFAGLSFFIDERALIPRSPIAELIENHFQPWIDDTPIESILDLCTGSGCIAIACAKYFPNAHVVASDISKEALEVAKINCLRHEVEDQVQLVESNLFEHIPKKKYDIIISNPPYVSIPEMESLPAEYQHEPKHALVAGEQGLDFACKILKQAPQYLQPHGILIVEVGNSEDALQNAFPHTPFTWIEFERGGGGVFLLTAEQLNAIEWKNK